ncbi:hypothetical protein DM40_4504 [Burkholderia cenocepacia]|nr:hypothetical protein DM40_4504 [Burkholderia cenocepacia]
MRPTMPSPRASPHTLSTRRPDACKESTTMSIRRIADVSAGSLPHACRTLRSRAR